MSLKNVFFKSPAWPLLFHLHKNGGLPLLFIMLISLPLADTYLSLSIPTRLDENRPLAAKPEWRLRDPAGFLKKFQAYFNDHFNFRSTLLISHNTIMVKCLQTSPIEKIIVGKKGWLFLDKEHQEPGAADYYRCLRPFSPPELRSWAKALKLRQEWFSRRGILYFFIVAPNKNSIYPEFMPARIRRGRTQTRLDQLLEFLKNTPPCPIIDLRDKMEREKTQYPLYPKTDDHWNPMGAYFAYVRIMETLQPHFPGLRPCALTHAQLAEKNYAGDLARMLSLDKHLFLERMTRIRLRPTLPMATSYRRGRYGAGIDERIDLYPGAALPPMLMVHDSFQRQLRPFLSRHFKRAIYLSDRRLPIYKKLIEANRIKVVFDQRVERALMFQSLDNSEIIN